MKNTFSFRICQIGMAERGGAEGTAYFSVFLFLGVEQKAHRFFM